MTDAVDQDQLKRICEAILFAHDGPVTVDLLLDVVPDVTRTDIRAAIDALADEYDQTSRSFEVVRVAGGYQICTRQAWSDWVARFQRGKRRVRLSRAAVETLGIIAYKQPVTRGDIEQVRGVDAGGVIHTLLERELIHVKGRAPGVGRPLLYATTQTFLEYFGLDSLAALPRLEEFEELAAEHAEVDEEVVTAPTAELPLTEADGGVAEPTGADTHG